MVRYPSEPRKKTCEKDSQHAETDPATAAPRSRSLRTDEAVEDTYRNETKQEDVTALHVSCRFTL